MMNMALYKREMKGSIKLLIIFGAIITLYVSVIISMYDPELMETLDSFVEVMPELMAAVGMTGIASDLLEWIQIYLYGFIMLLFPLIFILIMVQKLLMSQIESKTLANLLATPNSRKKIILTQICSMVLWMVLLHVLITAVGVAGCEIMFPGELDTGRYLALNFSTLLLQTAVTGIVFFAACCVSESKAYYLTGAGIPVLFFLFRMISNMGEKLEKLKYATIYSLLPAEEILKENMFFPIQNGVLLGIAAGLFAVGAIRFCRRDISL